MERDGDVDEFAFKYRTSVYLRVSFAIIALMTIFLFITFVNLIIPNSIPALILFSVILGWMVSIVIRIFKNRIVQAKFFESNFTVSYFHNEKRNYTYDDIEDVSLNYGPAQTSTTLTIFLKSGSEEDKLKLIINPRSEKERTDLHSFLLEKIGWKVDGASQQ